MSDRALAAARVLASEDVASGFLDDDYDWGPLNPYMDGDTLVIPVMDVIADSFWGSGLSAKSIQRALLKYKAATAIKVVINSPGGDVSQGIAVYTQLRMDGRPVEVHVIGLAASMASIVMLAGDTRILHTGAMVMVHEPWTWTSGDRHDFRSGADMLDAVANSMLDIYVERTGAGREELAGLMAAETWLTADEARSFGFGTAVEPAEPEPMMAVASADAEWNQRRGAALARCKRLPDEARHNAPLGWRGPSLEECQAANALARANQLPTFAMALDSVRRARPVAQQPQPREATPPPRPAPQPQPAASTSRTTPMDEETLKLLGLSPGATPEQIAAAVKAKAKAEAEAKAQAEAERIARIEAEARQAAAEDLRKKQEAAAAKAAEDAKINAEALSQIDTFLAGCTPAVRGLYGELCFEKKADGERIPKPGGLDLAKRMAETSPGALQSSLAGPSAQAQAARQAVASEAPPAPAAGAPILHRFSGSSLTFNLCKVARVTPEKIAARQAEMKARHEAKQQFGT